MKANTYFITNRYQRSRTVDRRPYVTLACERGGTAARLTEEQLKQPKQFRKSHVPPRNILQFFREQNVCCAVRYVLSSGDIFIFMMYIKKNRMHGRNTVEEVLYLSAKRGYRVFYKNCEESNILSDIVIAHPTSIIMMEEEDET
ncbi:hypothetical protein M9H77_25128 [Catharanthus roseus]|uniref:Uncharacterized protein n=1 Tax=Catharanthus roseus TaxID=4058 RepID=A0ACC0A631_CATRO|nr:hypothetical protein M9H77_25128 [Catharanthus roseus]